MGLFKKSPLAEVQEVIDSAARKRDEELEKLAILARDRAALAEDPHHADMDLRSARHAEAERRLLRGGKKRR